MNKSEFLTKEDRDRMVSYGKPNGQNTMKQPAPVIPTKMKKGGCGCGK